MSEVPSDQFDAIGTFGVGDLHALVDRVDIGVRTGDDIAGRGAAAERHVHVVARGRAVILDADVERAVTLDAVVVGDGVVELEHDLVVRPGLGGDIGVLWAVAAGTCYGTFLTMSRWLSGRGTPMALTFTQLLISAFLLLPLGLWHAPAPSWQVAGLTVASAFCSMMGNLLLLYAYRVAPATKLAPLIYFQLIAAVLLGWMIFGDLPDSFTWAGLALIIGAGLASARLR